MSLLPTPYPMPIIASGNTFPITELYFHGHRQHHGLSNQPYLLVNPDRSLYPNYYSVYVPVIGSPSTLTLNILSSTMSTSILQTSRLLNSLLKSTSLYNTQSLSNVFVRNSNAIASNISSSSIAFIREQYRYNMRPSYRYVQLL